MVIGRARLVRARGNAQLVEMSPAKDGAHVEVVGSRNPFRSPTGGLSLALTGAAAVRLELAFRRPGNVRRVFVELVDDAGVPTARWTWRRWNPLRRPSTTPQTFLLFPGRSSGPFRAKGPVRDAVATSANIYMEVLPTRSAGFSLRRAAALRDRPA